MKSYDGIVIGNNATGRLTAAHLAASGRKIALVSTGNAEETYQERLMDLLTEGHLSAETNFLYGEAVGAGAEGRPYEPVSIEGVDAFIGSCRFVAPTIVEGGGETFQSKRIIIACGAGPRWPADKAATSPMKTPLDAASLSSNGAVIAVAGGGPVGVLTADFLRRRGGTVILLTTRTRLLEDEEPEISAACEARLTSSGVSVRTAFAEKIPEGAIFAKGFTPNTAPLNLAAAGVYLNDEGAIVVNDEMRASVAGIWAVGAATGEFNIALQRHHAEIAAHNAFAPFFERRRLSTEPAPWALTAPGPLARVGLTESAAMKSHRHVLSASASETGGADKEATFLKIVGRAKNGEMLGAHAAGPGAGELILFFDLALRAGISLFDIDEAHHYPALTKAPLAFKVVTEWIRTAASA